MATFPVNTSITDLSMYRRRIWTQTRQRNRYDQPVLKDTGWDLVHYEGFPEGIEPGVNTFEQRADGKVPDARYTGIEIVDELSSIAKLATSTGGPIPRDGI